MAKTIDIQPSKLVLTDDTTLSAHTIYANNDEIDIDKPIKPDGVKARSSSDLEITLESGQKLLVKDNTGASLIDLENDNGIINILKQSRCRAYRGASNQSIASGAWTKVQYNTVSYDEQNEYDESTNFRFTATRKGYYLVLAEIAIGGMADGKTMQLEIRKNGTAHATNRRQCATSGDANVDVQSVVYLDAGEYIEVFAYHDFGSDRDIVAAGNHSFLCVHKLS